VTPPGIDPGTVRLVGQRLNHYATPGPSFRVIIVTKFCARSIMSKWKIQLIWNTMLFRLVFTDVPRESFVSFFRVK
jgi:hypothetical protein